MKQIQITDSNAKKLFKDMPEFRPALIDSFGEKFFSEKITDRVKTWEDVCEIKAQHPINSLPYPNPKNTAESWLNACKQLNDIREVLNEGWVPDWTNTNQRKWYPYFQYKSGSGFSFDGCGNGGWASAVGSRLCYKSSELAEYSAKQFADLYNQFLTL